MARLWEGYHSGQSVKPRREFMDPTNVSWAVEVSAC